ncbi:MAG: methionine--tRNA ligase [Planctomycetota bacterium]
MSQTFYITTAIDYPNGVPHMGHAYEKVVADFYARFARASGQNCRLLIGLDEHGQKIQEAAQAAEMSPQDFVDDKAKAFYSLYRELDVSYDDFVRTSEPRHHEFASEIYQKALDNGDIYEGVYQADYCISCEKALTKSELEDGKCPVHDREVTQIEEPSYFFRLGKYSDAVKDYIETNPEFIAPKERRNEILSRLDGDVHDLSISRSTFDWGVPLPNDPKHVLYVWFDALSNYVSALKKPDASQFDTFWPADCHVIGKDILWFHTVIWPAMLLAADIPLPKQVFVHGFILDKDGRKMAKTLGNVIDPREVAQDFSVDVLRYYFLRAFASGLDGRFSLEDLEKRYQSELGNDFGNLVMRASKLALTRVGDEVVTPDTLDLAESGVKMREEYARHVAARDHNRALESLWAYIRETNTYLNDRAPWKMEDGPDLVRVIASTLDALRTIVHHLAPAMPTDSERAAQILGIKIGPFASLGEPQSTFRVQEAQALFPRREKPDDEKTKQPKEKKMEDKKEDKKKGGGQQVVDPYAKLELRVARIDEVNAHPDADSLWHMSVDVGGEPRSICAGLREHLTEEELSGRKVLIVANLKPAKLRGIESRGMILASDRKDGKVVPVDPGEAESGDLVIVEGIESRPKKKLSKSDFDKAPLTVQGGLVTYDGKPLQTPSGTVSCDADDGAPVR